MTAPLVEAPSPIAAGQAQEESTSHRAIIADDAAGCAAVEAADKRVRTVIAKAAMAGIKVHIVSKPRGGGELIAMRWQHSRTFAPADALEVWLARVAGVQS